METITVKDLLKPNTIWEYKNEGERAHVLNECAKLGYKKTKDKSTTLSRDKWNAVLVLDNNTILETSTKEHVKDIRHTKKLKHFKVTDHR